MPLDRSLKRWEIALMAGVLCALLCGFWLGEEQTQLADRVIRFHVIANSDSPEDQALKLQVRDAVLSATQEFYPQEASLEEARDALSDHLGELARTGQETVEAAGYDYPVTASLEKCWFPTKEYDGFALPAGEYTALRVVIGAGGGLRHGGGRRRRGVLLPGPGRPHHRGGPGLCAEIQIHGAAGAAAGVPVFLTEKRRPDGRRSRLSKKSKDFSDSL